MIKDIINLAILNAFTMDPADISYPLYKRIPGKKLALLNWGPSQIKVGFAIKTPDGFEVAPEQMSMPSDTPVAKVVEALKARTDCNCVALLYNAVNLFCEVQTDIKKDLTSVDLDQKLRTSPKEIIGAEYENDKIYQVLTSPDRKSRMIFSTNREPYEELEKQLKAGGLIVVRSQMGVYAMLNGMLADDIWKNCETQTDIILPTIINQTHVIVAGFDGEEFWPDIFRASPLFWESEDKMDSPEFVEQLRTYFLNCAETAVLSRQVIGKRVVFKFLSSHTSPEAANDIASYLDDRIEVAFESFHAEPNFEFKSLLLG